VTKSFCDHVINFTAMENIWKLYSYIGCNIGDVCNFDCKTNTVDIF